MMVSGGVIAEQGTHDELLDKNGIYKELYETQFRTILDLETQEEIEEGSVGMSE